MQKGGTEGSNPSLTAFKNPNDVSAAPVLNFHAIICKIRNLIVNHDGTGCLMSKFSYFSFIVMLYEKIS